MLFELAYLLSDRKTKDIIDEDVARYIKFCASYCKKEKPLKKLSCILKRKEYLAVFRYRIRGSNVLSRAMLMAGRVFRHIPDTVEIGGDIGPGFIISHVNSIVYLSKAGKNLRIGPGVVIGKKGNTVPRIGDNVYITANATVIGDIKIGNNVIIGAGAVVVKDVPDNSVVVGNPARVVRKVNSDDFYEIM